MHPWSLLACFITWNDRCRFFMMLCRLIFHSNACYILRCVLGSCVGIAEQQSTVPAKILTKWQRRSCRFKGKWSSGGHSSYGLCTAPSETTHPQWKTLDYYIHLNLVTCHPCFFFNFAKDSLFNFFIIGDDNCKECSWVINEHAFWRPCCLYLVKNKYSNKVFFVINWDNNSNFHQMVFVYCLEGKDALYYAMWKIPLSNINCAPCEFNCSIIAKEETSLQEYGEWNVWWTVTRFVFMLLNKGRHNWQGCVATTSNLNALVSLAPVTWLFNW